MPCVIYGQSFSCVGLRFRAWATVFVRGQPFSCGGDRFRAWATVFMRGRPSSCGRSFSCVGLRFRAWATIFVRVGDRLRAWRSFPCVGTRFRAWAVGLMRGWLLALVGSLFRVGSLSCGVVVLWFSWDNSGRVGGAYRVEEQRQTTNFHSSFVVRLPRHGQ